MKLTFSRPHISISSLNEVSLPEFTIITGRNGSGKSHLLQALEQGAITIEGIDISKIRRFDYNSFRLEDESPFNRENRDNDRINTGWNPYNAQHKQEIENKLSEYLGTYLDFYKNLAKTENKSITRITVNQIEASEPTYKKGTEARQVYTNFKQNWKTYLRTNSLHYRVNQTAEAAQKLITELERIDFSSYYPADSGVQEIIPRQLSQVFLEYWESRLANDGKRLCYENDVDGRYKDLKFLSEEDFSELHGKEPWTMINELLKDFGDLNISIKDPTSGLCSGLDNYKLVVENRFYPDIDIPFTHLSSGEKTIMAFIASLYQSNRHGGLFPELILLDEIDASLHPSMLQQLVKNLSEVFVKQHGVKVILVTHSPSTVAVAEDGCIYSLSAGNNSSSEERKLEKIGRNDAIEMLSEGFLTPTDAIEIVLGDKQRLYAEGETDIKYLQKAVDLGLDKNRVLSLLELKPAGGEGGLKKIYKGLAPIVKENYLGTISKKVFVFDADVNMPDADVDGVLFKRSFPFQESHSVKRGSEASRAATTAADRRRRR